MSGELNRFVEAQSCAFSGYGVALGELRQGRKQGHWMWYVFPQLKGLGTSYQARLYGIDGMEEAVAYVQHAVLGARLEEVVEVLLGHLRGEPPLALSQILPGVDAAKFVSCATLFEAAADRAYVQGFEERHARLGNALARVLKLAAVEGLERCPLTLKRLGPASVAGA